MSSEGSHWAQQQAREGSRLLIKLSTFQRAQAYYTDHTPPLHTHAALCAEPAARGMRLWAHTRANPTRSYAINSTLDDVIECVCSTWCAATCSARRTQQGVGLPNSPLAEVCGGGRTRTHTGEDKGYESLRRRTVLQALHKEDAGASALSAVHTGVCVWAWKWGGGTDSCEPQEM